MVVKETGYALCVTSQYDVF